MAALLTTASTVKCLHGGTVAIVSTNSAVIGGGGPLALATDTFTVAGCPFQIPVGTGTVPHPCVTVQWTKTNTKTLVNGTPTLGEDSAGVGVAADQAPQGPVSIVAGQAQASGL